MLGVANSLLRNYRYTAKTKMIHFCFLDGAHELMFCISFRVTLTQVHVKSDIAQNNVFICKNKLKKTKFQQDQLKKALKWIRSRIDLGAGSASK